MAFVVDDFAAWLIGALSDAGIKRLAVLAFGSDQERSLRDAAEAAVRGVAAELRPGPGDGAAELEMVIGQVFAEPVPGGSFAGKGTLLESIQAGICEQLATLGDVEVTGAGVSSAQALGIPAPVLAERLAWHLERQIRERGARGGPLSALASQLNHDVTHRQGQRLEKMMSRVLDAVAGTGSASPSDAALTAGQLAVPAIPLPVAVKDPSVVFAAAIVEEFTGREWLVDAVDLFLRDEPGGYILIEADAGLGKTAFAAWLVKFRRYVSHFAHYSGGRTTRGALQNLSAQLVERFGLAALTPGGALPEWAQAPAGFESLLGLAAARAQAQGDRVVLVVDGLDEAEPSGEDLPFGLPLLLPENVYVIGTYRTGRPPARSDSPMTIVQIRKDDHRNRSDIRGFLARTLTEGQLRSQLAGAGMDPEEFAALLAERCDGVWVYLRYVLEELRTGLRQPGEVDGLPRGLLGYYASQFRRWRTGPAWETAMLPLLATLAVTREPLEAVTLARLAGGLVLADVRRYCDSTLRPFLTTAAAANSAALRYEIYHSSLREVLAAEASGMRGSADGSQPYELAALADELRQATLDAHNRIADTYLSAFGGPGKGLPNLGEDAAMTDTDGGFPLRHLVSHLHDAGRAADLRALLTADHEIAQGRWVNAWFAAHERAASLGSYLEDLATARRLSESATNNSLAGHLPATALGAEIRYTLMSASVTAIADDLPADLPGLLLAAGIWSPSRALDHARRLTRPADRLHALISVYPHLPAQDKPTVEAQLMASTEAVSSTDRIVALAYTSLLVPPDGRAAIIARALGTLDSIPGEHVRAKALAILAPRLPAGFTDQALAAAETLRDPLARATAMTGLLSHLSPDRRPGITAQALAAAKAVGVQRHRLLALAELSPHLKPAQRSLTLIKILEEVAAPAEDTDAETLTLLAPYFPDERKAGIATRALKAVIDEERAQSERPEDISAVSWVMTSLLTAIMSGGDEKRARIVADLAPHLPPESLDQAVSVAAAFGSDEARACALGSLVPYLPPERKLPIASDALTAALAVARDGERAAALAELAARLPEELLGRAVDAARAIADPAARARALTGIAPFLMPGQRKSALCQAVEAAGNFNGQLARARALKGLAPHLPAGQQAAAFAEALAAAGASTSDERCLVLAELATDLPEDMREDALSQALDAVLATTERTQYLFTAMPILVPQLPVDLLRRALSDVAAAEEFIQAMFLGTAAPYLPADLLSQALSIAIAISHEYERSECLACLAPYLGPDMRTRALEAAQAISENVERVATLASIAAHLPPGQQNAILEQALAAAVTLTQDHDTSRALSAVMRPHLTADMLSQLLTAAKAINEPKERAKALTELALYITTAQRPEAIELAYSAAVLITTDAERSQALTDLLPWLPPDRRPAAVAKAFAAASGSTAAEGIDVPNALAWAVEGIVPHLPDSLLEQALHVATRLACEGGGTFAITALAPRLPADQLARALTAVSTASSDEDRASGLADLAPLLPLDLIHSAIATCPKDHPYAIAALLDRAFQLTSTDSRPVWISLLRSALREMKRDACLEVIELLAPSIADIGGPETIQECVDAISDINRWWT